MTPEQLVAKLATLDSLYRQQNSFKFSLAPDKRVLEDYERIKGEIEKDFSGLCVQYVDLTFVRTHVLARKM